MKKRKEGEAEEGNDRRGKRGEKGGDEKKQEVRKSVCEERGREEANEEW